MSNKIIIISLVGLAVINIAAGFVGFKKIQLGQRLQTQMIDFLANQKSELDVLKTSITEIKQQISSMSDTNKPEANLGRSVLYANNKYGFKVTTSEVCKKQFLVKESPLSSEDKTNKIALGIAVYVPLSKQWSVDNRWLGYWIMSEEDYKKNPLSGDFGTYGIELLTSNKYVLVQWPSHDLPQDIDNCSIKVENL